MIYSTRFFGGVCPTSTTVVYTVPANNVVVLRDIVAWNGTTASDTINVRVNLSGLDLTFWRFTNLASFTNAQWTGRQVLNAGDELEVNSASGNSVLLISGYLLS